MKDLSVDPIFKSIGKTGVIAVVVLDELKHALPLVNSLLKGGVNAIELTLRTPVAIEAGRIIKKNVPEMMLGFGTVLTIDQVKEISDLGADFAVAPGCNPSIIQESKKINLPFAPGIMTPSDIEVAVENGCRLLKFFPAETSGGIKHLESMAAPYNFLDLRFIPLGGINIGNAQTYLESPLISAVGGSWIAKQNLIQSENWDLITQNAIEIQTLIKDLNNKR